MNVRIICKCRACDWVQGCVAEEIFRESIVKCAKCGTVAIAVEVLQCVVATDKELTPELLNNDDVIVLGPIIKTG